MKLTLGFSPCPNDTFIFDAMVHGKIDTEGLNFDVVMTDVEELNRKAFKKELDITKVSFYAYAYLMDDYVLLDAGSALGKNCGPLLISKTSINPASRQARHQPSTLPPGMRDINHFRIAIPGKYTTANFLLSIAFPDANKKIGMRFDQVEDAILDGEVDVGVIIHENRFTYQQKGLKKIIDLGEFWEELTKFPIPLGGIVVKRDISSNLQEKVNRVLKKSVEFALANPDSSTDFVRSNAQEMSEEVINKHIELYVNDYTVDLGEKGRKAVKTMFDMAADKGLMNKRCF